MEKRALDSAVWLGEDAAAGLGILCWQRPGIFLSSHQTMVWKNFKDTGSYGLVSTIGLLCFPANLQKVKGKTLRTVCFPILEKHRIQNT